MRLRQRTVRWSAGVLAAAVAIGGGQDASACNGALELRKIAASGLVRYNFSLALTDAATATGIRLSAPNKVTDSSNSLRMNYIELVSPPLTLAQLDAQFPSGLYQVYCSPGTTPAIAVNLTRAFPSLPAITAPANGALIADRTPTVTWTVATSPNAFVLQLVRNNGRITELNVELPGSARSYTIPEGVLSANAQYALLLNARKAIGAAGSGNALVSGRQITFSTTP